ncbi:MAG: peptidoglycan-binding protein [Comamonadaceae bacterium]|nr:MAG: peptidoglycan-binding protein [Comamonadaceae bacterium]
MYAPYFGLTQAPFSIAPDPRLLFMSERHREALAHLLYGLSGGGGFVLLTGEIGTGKTTVCRLFLEQVPADCNVAYIFNPKLTVTELLQSICDEFGIAVAQSLRQAQADRGGATVKDYLDPLNAFLLQSHAAGRNNVLIIDEAQNLSAEVLEQLRLLTNLETSERKLLQIILIGQPELRTMLQRPELEQLAQRVIARYHLDALTAPETQQYIQHRLEVSGLNRALPFDRGALRRIHELSRGVPRRINLLCDRALLGAFAGGKDTVNRAIVDHAAGEVFDVPKKRDLALWQRSLAVLGLSVAAGAVLVVVIRLVAPAPAVQAPPAALAPAGPASAASAASAASPASAPGAAPAVAAQPAPPAVPPMLLSSEDQAWRELAQAWKASPGPGDPCRSLAQEQLQCFSRNTSLALIRQLGRPGILALDTDSTAPSYALLTGLTADSATLRAGNSEQTVTLAALGQRWKGDFSTLWRAPEGYDLRRAKARTSPAVLQWMAVQLAKAGGASTAAGSASTEAALAPRVRAFQVAQGLPADGRPGPMTFMQLNRIAGVDEPRLRTEP